MKPLDLEELAKLANERIQFVKDTGLAFHAGGDTRLAEGVLRLLSECESLRAPLSETEKHPDEITWSMVLEKLLKPDKQRGK